MTIRHALLILLFCSTAYSGDQVGNFAPREIGNKWVYEGIYEYGGMQGAGTTTFIRSVTVISNRIIADTEYVVIEIQDTVHETNALYEPKDTSYLSLRIDTCKFLAGTLIYPDLNNKNVSLFWGGIPFCSSSTINRDSLSEFLNGDTSLYYVDGRAVEDNGIRYVKDIGLCTYQTVAPFNTWYKHSINLISFNGQPYDPGESVVKMVRSLYSNLIAINENDTIQGVQPVYDHIIINLRYSKFDKIGNNLGNINAYWTTTGSLSNSHSPLEEGEIYFEFRTTDTSYQEGYITATPVDSGIVLHPDRVYVIIDPTAIVMAPRQRIHQSGMHRIRSVYNLLGRKVPVYEPKKALRSGFRIICDDRGAKKQLFVMPHR